MWDALDRQEQVTRLYATAALVTEYDEAGNAIRLSKPDGCQIEMAFDLMNRLEHRRSLPGCPAVPVDDEFGYDPRGMTCSQETGPSRMSLLPSKEERCAEDSTA